MFVLSINKAYFMPNSGAHSEDAKKASFLPNVQFNKLITKIITTIFQFCFKTFYLNSHCFYI